MWLLVVFEMEKSAFRFQCPGPAFSTFKGGLRRVFIMQWSGILLKRLGSYFQESSNEMNLFFSQQFIAGNATIVDDA